MAYIRNLNIEIEECSGNTLSGGVSYHDRKNDQFFSFYVTDYQGGNDDQTVGGIGYNKGDFSFRLENDFLLFNGQDRWRTSAVELGIGDYVIGTHVYTNDPKGEKSEVDPNGVNLAGKKNKHGFGAWVQGLVHRAPAYIGYKSGRNIIRIGYSSKYIQNATQNWVHRNGFFYLPFGYQNYYNKYVENMERWYSTSGRYNPFSLF